MTDARQEALDAVIDAIERNGLGARSLRDLARDAGTSHRMLIHHFGSRDGLLVAIVSEVEARQRELLRTTPTDDGADVLMSTWKRLTDRALWPLERLFFECYARGAQGEEPFARLIPALVDDWVEMLPRHRRDEGRLTLAVIRGLLLDLVATEDRAGVNRAMQRYVQLAGQAAQ